MRSHDTVDTSIPQRESTRLFKNLKFIHQNRWLGDCEFIVSNSHIRDMWNKQKKKVWGHEVIRTSIMIWFWSKMTNMTSFNPFCTFPNHWSHDTHIEARCNTPNDPCCTCSVKVEEMVAMVMGVVVVMVMVMGVVVWVDDRWAHCCSRCHCPSWPHQWAGNTFDGSRAGNISGTGIHGHAY